MTERFTVDSDGKWWDRITHEYVTLDNLFRTVEELDNKLESKQHTINEMAKTIRIYDDGYIDLNKKYKKLKDENEQLKKGMIEVVDRYIKNVECNPPSSARTYGKIKGALVNIREDLRNLIGRLE